MTKVGHNQFGAVCKYVGSLIKWPSVPFQRFTPVVSHVNDKTKLGMLGTIPNGVMGFHQYSSLFKHHHHTQVAVG